MITPKFYIWLKAAGIRSLKTIAQTTIATIGTTAAWGDVDWKFVGSSALLAGFLSILTSLAGLPEVEAEQEKKELEEARRINGQD